MIEFYASALPPPTANNFTWFHNGFSNISTGTFSDNMKVLTIPSVQFSDSGEYTFRVQIMFSANSFGTAVATTNLTVISKYDAQHYYASFEKNKCLLL